MLTQSKATIFLSGERVEQKSEIYRCYSTLKTGGNNPFPSLVSFDEITVAGGNSCMTDTGSNLDYLILPIVGTLYVESEKANNLVNPGQSLFISPEKNHDLIITNPYGDELVNFLQIGFSRPARYGVSPAKVFSFDMDNNKNRMLAFGDQHGNDAGFLKAAIGKFDGRSEFIYQSASPANGVFVFVITGAFEVQYRLLEAKDGLAIWDLHDIELEALSNEAILLTIELPLPASKG